MATKVYQKGALGRSLVDALTGLVAEDVMELDDAKRCLKYFDAVSVILATVRSSLKQAVTARMEEVAKSKVRIEVTTLSCSL